MIFIVIFCISTPDKECVASVNGDRLAACASICAKKKDVLAMLSPGPGRLAGILPSNVSEPPLVTRATSSLISKKDKGRRRFYCRSSVVLSRWFECLKVRSTVNVRMVKVKLGDWGLTKRQCKMSHGMDISVLRFVSLHSGLECDQHLHDARMDAGAITNYSSLRY